MDALTSLERDVVWRFETPSRAALERLRARVVADLARKIDVPPPRPFVVVSPAGMRRAIELERALCVRGARVVEKRFHPRWPRSAAIAIARELASGAANDIARELTSDALTRAYLHEELWNGLFPRGHAEVWILEDERALERALAWRDALREVAPGVRVTVQGVLESSEVDLEPFHLPIERHLEREWRAWCGAQAA